MQNEVTFLSDRHVLFNSGQQLTNIHTEDLCSGRACPIHNPSDHPLRGEDIYFNGRHMVRQVHGELFLDPDDYYATLDDEIILRNSATCALCGDMVQSLWLYGNVSCVCGEIIIYGGGGSIGHHARNEENLIDTSIVIVKP